MPTTRSVSCADVLRRIGVERGHRQHRADVQVQQGGGRLVDRDLPWRVRRGQPPGEQLRDLHRAAEAAVERREDRGDRVERAVGLDRLGVDADDGSRGRHAWQGAESLIEAGHPGARRGDERVRGTRGGEEPRVGGVGAQRAGRGGEHGAAGDRDQHREGGPAAPAGAELVRGEPECRAHAAARTNIMAANVRAGARPAAREVARGPGCASTTTAFWVARPLAPTVSHMGKLGPWRRDMPSTSSSRTTT